MRILHRALPITIAACAFIAAACHRESALPKLFVVPNASLVASTGKPVHLDEMKGRVVVYDFIFTNCAGTCPLMSHKMKTLTKEIGTDEPVRFVSISVDPERDTPEVLRAYAKRLDADDRWLFLTGKHDDVIHLSVDGFKLAAGGTPQPGAEPLLHSAKFVIADKHGVIREYASAIDDDSLDHAKSVIRELSRED